MIFLFNWVIFRFQPLIFQADPGVNLYYGKGVGARMRDDARNE